jgi:glyceraldehyde 3-phosphate dehydrogenase
MKIAINGFGRIGRSVTRIAYKNHELEINDIMPIEMAAYLLSHDTIRGDLNVEIENDTLVVDGKKIKYHNFKHPSQNSFESDVVIECSGKFLTSDEVEGYLKRSKKVIISAPANDDTPTYVLGVNENEYAGEKIISNASCTTNCLAPIAKIIDNHFRIKQGFITTIHSYTMDQKLLDSPNYRDYRRSRAAASNIIPTFTGAAKAIYKVLPQLKGKLDGRSVRVPVNNVSLLDFVVEVEKESSVDEVNNIIKQYVDHHILGIDEKYSVSSDIVNRSESSVFVPDLTQVNGHLFKIFSWYDNEWGYANRLVEMAEYILFGKK